ncbi:Uu.00g087490.m01.CDS01 [Anthostomella pinea]|uniref:carboxypeptidase C n=1 Tax=Anthostomella pinea TaxID=933095 RepID=A0AAI8YK47_9PEZI|nr:Uu.00g087490.m01.CDS01 [Anthostomella pinea]
MRSHFLLAAIAVTGVVGQLVTPKLNSLLYKQPLLPALPRGDGVSSLDQQKPMYSGQSSRQYIVREQNETVCDAGSRQWTGWIHVTEEKSLFYWFFESRSNPLNDPVMIWLNGGPGGSSMMGLFQEIGPCLTNEYQNGTKFNEHSWTEFANVIFIDQPASVGFSMVNNDTMGGPDNLREASQDFNKFLSVFFEEVFPGFSQLPLHIAGESFGGTYVPGFVEYISRRQQLGVPGTFNGTIHSITLVDAVIDILGSGALGQYDHMCQFENGENKKKFGFSKETCAVFEPAVPECERLNRQCLDTYDGNICRAAYIFCAEEIVSSIDPKPGGRNPYDDRILCNGTLPLCGIGSYEQQYLNTAHVQDALGLDHWNFSSVNYDLNSRWTASNEIFLPTTRELTYILDETPTRVFVLNGNNDIVVSTEGQKRVYNQQPWNHQAKYRMEPYVTWSWPDRSGKRHKGGEFKGPDDKRELVFASVDEAGHTSPADQKEAVAYLMKWWVNEGDGSALSQVLGS